MDRKNMEKTHEKCSKCRCWRLPETYMNANGRRLKTCWHCRDYQQQIRDRDRGYPCVEQVTTIQNPEWAHLQIKPQEQSMLTAILWICNTNNTKKRFDMLEVIRKEVEETTILRHQRDVAQVDRDHLQHVQTPREEGKDDHIHI